MGIEEKLDALLGGIAEVSDRLARLEQKIDPPKRMEKKFMCISELTERTGMARKTIINLCGRNEISYSKVGKTIMVRTDSILDYIEKKSIPSIRERAAELLKGRETITFER